jgi:16S rRNA (uracil1498-N3)-methyltransferase
MAWEEPDQKRVTLKSVLSKIPKPDQIMIFIGPEGGIDAQEAKILQRLGFHTVSLGETILRVEHAAFSMLSNILYEYSQGS